MSGFQVGQRVKLAANREGIWLAALSNGIYLDLNDQPTGIITGIRSGREPEADVFVVAIDGHPAPGRAWPDAWILSRGLLLPAAEGEIRPAPVVDGIGRPVAAETLARALRELDHARHAAAPMFRADPRQGDQDGPGL